MGSAWMSFCPDPNVIYEYPDLYPPDLYPELYDPNLFPDPNCPCEIADINKDYYVDPNDLLIMTEYWLENGF